MTIFTEAAAADGGGGAFIWIILLVMIGVMYLTTIRPQKNEEKKQKEMINAMEVGDEVITTGGIVGRIVNVSGADETVVIETGSDRNRIRIAKWAIRANVTRQKAEADRKKEAIVAKQKEKQDKKK